VAHIAPPGPNAFYRGTRFDQAGVVTSLILKGREFYGPWFDRTAPNVLDYAYDAKGALVGGPDSATSGPVEEFAPLDFKAAPGFFVKIGVGTLRQPDAQPYDHYRHYKVEDPGTWTISPSQTGVTFIQVLKHGETAYTYEKILRLVQGNAGTEITFPFLFTIAANPPPPDLIRIEGKTLTYLRPMKPKERISFLVTGFAETVADYDIAIRAGEAGVNIKGDQPITRLNIFSIDKVQSVEPYIALNIAPGQEKRWSYTYTFTVPD
jgi:hypothetical protein